MKWIPTCKETTVLASRAMAARLPFADRVAMQLHLLAHLRELRPLRPAAA